jgi:hypothetical protein
MRQEALRPATQRQAQEQKLKTRLSKGEKRNRTRMAEVCAIHEVAPAPRTAADILPADDNERAAARPAPEAKNKWLTASVTEDAATIVGDMFTEADRRDPGHERTWVALVDGNNHQIDRITKEARKRKPKVTILIDVIHALDKLCLHWTLTFLRWSLGLIRPAVSSRLQDLSPVVGVGCAWV